MTDTSSVKPGGVPAGTAGLFLLATAAALVTVLLWGGSSLATKLGTGSVDGFTLAVLRIVAAGPFALILVAMMRLRLPWHDGYRLYFSIIAIVGMAAAALVAWHHRGVLWRVDPDCRVGRVGLDRRDVAGRSTGHVSRFGRLDRLLSR